MTNSNAIKQMQETTNGVDVGQLMNVIGAIEADPSYAKFQWRATNEWINGAGLVALHNKSGPSLVHPLVMLNQRSRQLSRLPTVLRSYQQKNAGDGDSNEKEISRVCDRYPANVATCYICQCLVVILARRLVITR
jgi:hypothetical protein